MDELEQAGQEVKEETAEEVVAPELGPTETQYKNLKVIPVQLNEDEEARVKAIIREELEKIAQEYGEAKYYEKLKAAEKEYEGKVDDLDDVSRKKMMLTALTVDIVASRGIRQTFGVRPFMLLEKDEEITDDELRDWQDSLDFRARNKAKLPELDYIAYKKACLEGAAVVKTPLAKEVEHRTKKETYKYGELAKYEASVDRAKLFDPQSREFKDWQSIAALQPGGTYSVEQETEKVIFYGPKPSRVDLNKFYARLKIKDFRKHIFIGEEMAFQWSDIEARKASGYYDAKKVDKLKEQCGEDYWKKDYRIMEGILYADIKKEGRFRRYLVSYDVDKEIVLRVIFYPYDDIFYTVYNAIPRDDSWMGYSFNEKMKHVVSIAESFLNSTVNESNIAHNFTVLTDDATFEANRGTFSVNEGEINVLAFKPGTKFQQMKFDYSPADRVGMLQWAISFAELISGVSASLMSGAETPDDPRAPAAKSAMKMQATNMRVEDVVMNLQKGDEEVARQIDKIDVEYPDNDEGVFRYFTGGQAKEIKLDTLNRKVRYVAHGSRLAFDKASDVQVAMQTASFVMQALPEVWNDYEAKLAIWNIILNNSEGSIEKNKDILMQPLKLLVDAVREQKEQMKMGMMPMGMPGNMPMQGQPPMPPQMPGQPPMGGMQ